MLKIRIVFAEVSICPETMKLLRKSLRETHFEATVTCFEFARRFRLIPGGSPSGPPPRTPVGGCPLGPFSHFGPRPLTAADTGARGARAPYKMARASRRLREYLARFLGVSGADFNAAPLGKPPLRPPRRGAKTEGFTSENLISRLRPSPTFSYPRVCVHHFHAIPQFSTNFILARFLPPMVHAP